MSFDLERAKQEGCIYVTPDGEFPALILSDSLKGREALAVSVRFDDDHLLQLPRSGSHSSRIYLKNKPQKLEVRIYKDSYGNFLSFAEGQGYQLAAQGFQLIKTIEVEI